MKTISKETADRPLGLIGWVKARLLARRLRRRWKKDKAYQARIRASIEGAIRKDLEKRKTIKTQ